MIDNPHWWWDVPEFVREQQDPEWVAWVAALEDGIDLVVDTPEDWFPGIPEDWFSDEAIQFVEKTLLDRYEDQMALDSNWDDKWKFIKYLGQAFVDQLECKWVWQPKIEKYGWHIAGPAIECPWPDNVLFDVIPMVNATVKRRTGREWIFVFRNNREDYLEWKSGRGEQ